MPKMKSHRGAAKRFKRTGGGRFKHNQTNHGHLYTSKSSDRKRHLRKPAMVDKTDEGRLKRLLPYS